MLLPCADLGKWIEVEWAAAGAPPIAIEDFSFLSPDAQMLLRFPSTHSGH
jgi:hypothetical protein